MKTIIEIIGNDKVVDVDLLVRKLFRLQQNYITMLGEEIDSMSPLAATHGWRSKNIEIGERLRKQMKEVKKELS